MLSLFSYMMKMLGQLLVLMMVSTCLAVPRKAMPLGGIHGQEQRYRIERGKSIQGKSMENMSRVMYPERNVGNHHSIPRQNYNNRSGASQGDNPDNNDSETAQRMPPTFFYTGTATVYQINTKIG